MGHGRANVAGPVPLGEAWLAEGSFGGAWFDGAVAKGGAWVPVLALDPSSGDQVSKTSAKSLPAAARRCRAHTRGGSGRRGTVSSFGSELAMRSQPFAQLVEIDTLMRMYRGLVEQAVVPPE